MHFLNLDFIAKLQGETDSSFLLTLGLSLRLKALTISASALAALLVNLVHDFLDTLFLWVCTTPQLSTSILLISYSVLLDRMLEPDQFYLNKEEPNKSCLLALRSIILAQDIHITETRKYGMACFCYHKKMFCYLWTDKKTNEPYLLLVEGIHLDHPKLEAGKRSRMKILRVNPIKDLPIKTIETILKKALNLYKNGVIKLKG